MPQSRAIAPVGMRESDAESAWNIVRAACADAESAAAANQVVTFAITNSATLVPVPAGIPDAMLVWRPGIGWQALLPDDDPRRAFVDLYLPICSGTVAHPITVGHLGQSLDGFIATPAGESQWVTGQEDVQHMHRLRGICDVVIVGAGTVAADDPELTTRLVPGPSPLRVVIDPARRLDDHYRVFSHDSAETLYVCSQPLIRADERSFGRATIVGISEYRNRPGTIDVASLMRLLRARGCARVFVEGGGVTVSIFLEAGLLDRLHLAVAPLLIGNGRPAIRLVTRGALDDCRRPAHHVFRLGGDMLFDLDLRSAADGSTEGPPIERII